MMRRLHDEIEKNYHKQQIKWIFGNITLNNSTKIQVNQKSHPNLSDRQLTYTNRRSRKTKRAMSQIKQEKFPGLDNIYGELLKLKEEKGNHGSLHYSIE